MSPRFHTIEEQIVPACLCKNGFRPDCPYALQGHIDDFFAEKVDSREEDENTVLELDN